MATATTVLCLTADEAQTLMAVCDRIGGSPRTTRRRHMDAIRSALSAAGVKKTGGDDIDDTQRSIQFLPN
jgi:hypothetical protein